MQIVNGRRFLKDIFYEWWNVVINAHNDINFLLFVLPGLTKPAPYLIRGNPVLFWIPAFAEMTDPVPINVAMHEQERS
jgi:hypothetical protein